MSRRVYSVDAVRGFAIFAMVVAHTVVFTQQASPKALLFVESVLNDLAAPTFALIIGVSLALTSPAAADTRANRWSFRLQTAIKAAILIVLGFALEFAPSGVSVVLDYLGAILLAALPLIFLRTRWLLVVAALVAAAGPPLIELLRTAATNDPTLVSPTTPVTVILDWALLGHSYRISGLLPLLLIGVVIGRSVLGSRRRTLWLLGVAAFGLVVTQFWTFADLPGSGVRGGYVEVIRDACLAVGSFAVLSWLLDLTSPRVAAVARRVAEPLAVQGRMALSIYVFQVLLLIGIWASPIAAPDSPVWQGSPLGWAVQLGVLFSCWAFAAAWWRVLGTGPIERVMGVCTGRHPWSSLWAVAPRPAVSADRRSAAAPTS